MRLKPREISVVVTRPGYFTGDDQFAPVSDLPLPASELLDLLEKARVHDSKDDYKVLIDGCRKEYLHSHLADQPLNLLELNHLANMDGMDADIFEGYIKMWKEERPAPIRRIINLALSAAGNPMAYGIFNDEELGKMSFENDFFGELAALPEHMVQYLDYAKLGKERREAEGGVYTSHGYVPMHQAEEEIDSHYAPGSFPQLEDMLPAESLQVEFYRYILEAGTTGDISIVEALPISIERYQEIKNEIYCCDDELTLIPKFCVIPSLQEHISDTEPLENLNALAVCLDGARAMGKLPLYKALLEATECKAVKQAADLGCKQHEYLLDASITDTAQYARKELEKKLGAEEAGRMAKLQDLQYYGRELVKGKAVAVTEYGYLTRKDGGPILAHGDQVQRSEPAQQPAHHDSAALVAKSHKTLEQNYRAYMAHIAGMDTQAIFEEAATIVATKLVFEQLTDDSWPDGLYEVVSQHENPLLGARDHWLEHGQPKFSNWDFEMAMEEFFQYNEELAQQMTEQSL